MEPVTLQNASLRLTFDPLTGSLLQIEDLHTGAAHLQDSARARLFRVVVPHRLWQSRFADSHLSGPPQIEQAGERLRLHWPRLQAADGPLEVAATVEVHLPSDATEALFTLTLENHESDLLVEARFPWVGGWQATEDPPEALFGWLDVSTSFVPPRGERFAYNLAGRQRVRFLSHPQGPLMPVFSLSRGGAGLSLLCYEPRPRLGGLVLDNLDPEPEQLSMSWAWVHYPYLDPGGSWESPPLGLGVHAGDWHAVADRYRAWADTWWQPPSPPQRLRRSLGVQFVQTRGFDGQPLGHGWRDVPRLARAGLMYGIADLCLWDPLAGVYCRPDEGDFWEEFDPSQSLDDLRSALAEARELGVNVSTLVNYRLILRNTELFRRGGYEDLLLRGRYGTTPLEDYGGYGAGFASFTLPALSKQGVVLCPRPERFRERALQITRQTMDLGFTSLFIDQSFEIYPCFDPRHGHETPTDTHEAAVAWMVEAARLVREAGPEAYVMGEIPDVHGLQQLDLMWNWNWSDADARLEVVRYTFPEALQLWVVDRQPEVLNRAFVLGCLMALTTFQLEKSLAEYPQFGERVAQLARLRLATAEYTAEGRFRDELGLQAEGALAKVFASSAGLAVVVGNVSQEDRPVRLALDPLAHGRTPAGAGRWWRQDGSPLPVTGLTVEMDLPALEVAVWTVPCAPAAGDSPGPAPSG